MLTQDEKQVLSGLLDLAVKAGGLNVAANALYFVQKLELTSQKPAENGRRDESGVQGTEGGTPEAN